MMHCPCSKVGDVDKIFIPVDICHSCRACRWCAVAGESSGCWGGKLLFLAMLLVNIIIVYDFEKSHFKNGFHLVEENLLPQSPQLWGFSPVCTSWCWRDKLLKMVFESFLLNGINNTGNKIDFCVSALNISGWTPHKSIVKTILFFCFLSKSNLAVWRLYFYEN